MANNLHARISQRPPAGTDGADEPGETHGRISVGLCLSGGGSRALTAGLGQLRALHHLQANGASLLSQIDVISTVSGGSWLSVPWTFLKDPTTDADYLNEYVPDPGRLVVEPDGDHGDPANLSVLPVGNPGAHIASDFSILDMVLELIVLRIAHGTPWNMMWQSVIARRLLKPYGLFSPGKHYAPTTLFSQDLGTAQREIIEPNESLANETVHLVADGTGRTRRAELICNTSMVVKKAGSEFRFLAPVQVTPTAAGILGSPQGVTGVDDKPVGGGTVTSFALGSALLEVDGDAVTIEQERQLSLADITGLSSAAFAESLENFLTSTDAEPAALHAQIKARRDELLTKLGDTPHHHGLVRRALDELLEHTIDKVLRELDPVGLIPEYRYWPVLDATPDPDVSPSRFADGGSLENTGIAAMLTRGNIQRIIAGVNSGDPLEAATHGVIDADGVEAEGTRLKVAGEIPVLFGYRPYQEGIGYEPYGDTPDDDLGTDRIFRHNMVFDPSGFAPLLRALAAAAAGATGLQSKPAIVQQEHVVVANEWFGVRERSAEVTVVWIYLNDAADWHTLLAEPTAQHVRNLDGFPNYSTEHTELSPLAVNAMSSFAAWCVANDGNGKTFQGLFTNDST